MLKKLICMVICITLSGPAWAADYYVNLNSTGGNNGTSWTDAWTTMASAMTNTPSGSTINIGAGIFRDSAVWTPTNDNLTLKARDGKTVILSGDVNGDDVFENIEADPCALDKSCASGTHKDNRTIFNFDNKTIVLEDLILEGAKGHAIQMGGTSNVTATGCRFTQNHANNTTGACLNAHSEGVDGGYMTLTNCTFIQNSSWGRGSTIFSEQQGTVTITNCLFQINCAIDDAATVALLKYPLNVYITDSVFDRCIIKPNSGGNGGIFQRMISSDSQTTLTRCVFTGCVNAYGGGGPAAAYYLQGYANNGAITGLSVAIDNCLFFKNNATGENSALHFEDKIEGFDLTVNINNCTIADNRNTLNNQGALGYFINFDSTGATTIDIALKNTIVWGNTGGADMSNKAQIFVDTNRPYYGFGSVTADYCCWDNTDPNDWGYSQSLGTGNLVKSAIPTLDPLLTGDMSPATYNSPALNGYMLDPCSPCIDTGDPCSAYSAEPGCNGGRINMGWLGGTELATPKATTTKMADLDCDNDVDLADFSIMADQWLQ